MEGSIFSTLTSNELGIFFTGLGVALSAILSGIGSAIGVGKAGQAAAGVIADQPERFGNCLVLELLPGSQGIYGFAVSILILHNVDYGCCGIQPAFSAAAPNQ